MNQPMQLLQDTPTTHTQGRQLLTQTQAHYNVTVEWQEEGCYLALSEDIRGLVIEADTLDEMSRFLRAVVPDLLELAHGIMVSGDDLTITKSENSDKITYTISHPN